MNATDEKQQEKARTGTHYAETQYGFEFGAAKIERCCSDQKKGWVTLLLHTPKHKDGLQIYVTRTGKVRIHDFHEEWTPKGNK